MLVLVVSLTIYLGFRKLNDGFVKTQPDKFHLFIPTGSTFNDVRDSLVNGKFITDTTLFRLVSTKMGYDVKVKPGRYKLKDGWSVLGLVRHLRSGNQDPIRFTFNNIRFISKLASLVGSKLEADSARFMSLVESDDFLSQFGFNSANAKSIFLPNTYEINWNTSEVDFVKRMHDEYVKFWNEERKEKLKRIGLNMQEVSVLASIIQEETNKKDEMSRMAGVLVNRLRKDMKLQVDPTARYASGDFDVKRIRSSYTKIDSPYNTYIYKGLPPGPICMPNPSTIDLVLDFEENDYLFYCAKADGSGYHAFAKSDVEHARNAAAYHRFLNRIGIR